MAFDTSCLKSQIKNISGASITLTFLPRTVTLANNAVELFDGDILAALSGGMENRTKLESLLAAVKAGKLALKLPPPLVFTPNGTPKQVTVDNAGVVASAAPCWETVI